MKIAMLQLDIAWLNVHHNLSKIDQILSSSSETDLVVLCEMALTGYVLDPQQDLIIATYDQSIKGLKNLSIKHNTSFIASLPFYSNNSFTNRAILISANEEKVHSYDKIYLYTPAGESKHYTKGQSVETFDFQGYKIRPAICYDLRFPDIAFQGDYDILIYMANWPIPRIHHWRQLITARAIENQVYTIGVNRTGMDNNGLHYNGHSLAVAYDGSTVEKFENEEGIKIIEIDFNSQKVYRSSLPFRLDRR
jgi:omega-amidase